MERQLVGESGHAIVKCPFDDTTIKVKEDDYTDEENRTFVGYYGECPHCQGEVRVSLSCRRGEERLMTKKGAPVG